ncbi:MAG: flagellar basal body rod protein FlgB [Rhodospirillaceae bacterium]|jgi:flagellar basal-body rod protein FlgB|nr:flagellar basal body rod protein FlgB [Rhodospirillaceae bacterium]MBT7955562.1 flagellar basal body rod protein FlgB [Rhodospirillaceae bacterium]
MDITNLPMFGMLKERLNWINQRQQVVAQNIANADTPKYRARDLEKFDFQRTLREHAPKNAAGGGLALRVTNPMHIAGAGQSTAEAAASAMKKPYETAPDGNSVVLEEQMVKLNETAIQHSAMVGLYRKHLAMITSVVRGR